MEMAEAGDEQEALLERLLTRLALTDDSKLEPVLFKLLPYAISCLATPRQSTKQKVMDMLTHINKRIKDQPTIKLPLVELLALYQNEKTVPMVKNFALIYLEMAFDRHSKEDSDFAPEFLKHLSKVSSQQQDILLRMAAKDLEKYAFKSIEESSSASYAFMSNPVDRDIFLEFCLQTIIYQSSGNLAGLSKLQALRVSGKLPLKGDLLMKRKMGILNVISELNVPTTSIYPLLLVASVDSNDTVSKRAEDLLKKKTSGVNFEDPILIKKLFYIFQGTVGNNSLEDAKVYPGSPSVKEKLLSVFTRSIAAANSFPATIHCIFDCIFGTESFLRLKQAGMEFAVWVFKHARDEQMKPMAPIILSGVLKLLDSPPPGEGDTSAKQLRMFAYQAIGQLGKRAPHLFREKLDLVLRLFEAFKLEPLSLRFTVQETLTSLASAYKDCSEAVAKEISSLLLRNVYGVEGEARFCSVWWSANLYNFNHCASRFICMLGASDERLDVRDMALEGLVAKKHEKGAEIEYPLLSDMLDYICKQRPELMSPLKLGEQELLFHSKTYEAMIMFLMKCYDFCEENFLFNEQLFFVLGHGMAINGNIDLHIKASNGLLLLASKAPETFTEFCTGRVLWFKQFIRHIDASTRETMAKLLGIVVSTLSVSATVDLLGDLKSTFYQTSKSRFEDVHGAVCATGFIVAQCLTGVPKVPLQTISMIILSLVETGRSRNLEISAAAVEAIGHIGLRVSFLTLNDETDDANNQVDSAVGSSANPKVASKREISTSVRKFLSDVILSKDTKVLQKTAIAYGHICSDDSNEDLACEALDALFGTCRSKVEEVLFSVGEALCFIWGGLPVTADEILRTAFVTLSNASNFLNDYQLACDKTLPVTDDTEDERAKARDVIVGKLFDELLYSSRKEERCAGAVWLVSLITYCGKHPRIQKMLPEIQEAFSHLLGEQNELTQEMASKGLSVVYELGDSSAKQELVKALVNTLSGTSKRKRAIKLTEDSEVFEEGSLGEKPGGGNLTTYKELCSLANEMGQPDLIYKFMDLANHQASLNSKRGAAFGFARIARQAQDAISPYLPLLVPKLVRYQYDPNRLVQDAMGHIWRSIIPEPKKTIDEFFDVIMEDLLSQAGSRLWRSRESSCLALSDILQGRRFREVEKYLEQIWVVCFRAMDDVKETVRTSGVGLSRSVSSLTLRLTDTHLTSEREARSAVITVLPILLSKGILSNVADVQRLSINTVMKLAKNAGSSIRPQLPDLIVCMLESLSSLEDQRLNYAELHAEKAGISSEKLENIRISIARDSPMWETLDFCLQQIDEPVMEVLVPRLVQLVRGGVGLNTRVGVAKFISLLTHQQGSEMKKYAGMLLKVLKAVSQEEKSPASRHALVSACATVAKYASNTQIQSLFEDTIVLYDASTVNAQITSALLLRELSLQASDVFVDYHTMVLPLAFIARFDDNKTVSGMFEEIWEENTSGQGAALQLYASDIVPLAIKGLANTSWTQKKKSAKAITKLVEAASDSATPYVQLLLKALLEEMPSRLWEGKEVLLDAVCAICINYSGAVPDSSDMNIISKHAVMKAVLACCLKKKISFRNAAFSCLEQILLHCSNQALLEEVLAFLLQFSSSSSSLEKMSQGEDEVEADNNIAPTLEKALTCLKASIAGASTSTVCNGCEAITAFLVEKLSGGYSWQVKASALATTQAFVERLAQDKQQNAQIQIVKSFESLLFAALDCLTTIKIGQVRIVCLQCMLAILNSPFQPHVVKTLGKTVSDRVLLLTELEQNPSTKSLMQNILALLCPERT